MKWYAYVIMVLLWVVAVIAQISWSWWYLLVFILAANLIQYLLFGLWYGRRTGTNTYLNIVMNLLFGFVWWIPLQKRADQIKQAKKEAASAASEQK
jgi:hypothetical protein